MSPAINRLVIYTKKMEAMTAFYTRFFGFEAHRQEGDRIVELRPQSSGLTLLLHPAGKGQREGQSLVKLVFDVEDVEGVCRRMKQRGLEFGPIHKGDGYMFANAKDPSNNTISVSSRAYSALVT